MIYNDLSLDEILAKVNEKFTEEEQQSYAFSLVSDIYQYEDDEEELEEDFDAMAYLAEYFSHGEWKEWLCDTFLADEDEVVIDTNEGTLTCENKWDCELGSIIDIYDEDGECLGFIRGNLRDFTEEKLIEEVEDELENHWNDALYGEEDDDDIDDCDEEDAYDMDEGEWNY